MKMSSMHSNLLTIRSNRPESAMPIRIQLRIMNCKKNVKGVDKPVG